MGRPTSRFPVPCGTAQRAGVVVQENIAWSPLFAHSQDPLESHIRGTTSILKEGACEFMGEATDAYLRVQY